MKRYAVAFTLLAALAQSQAWAADAKPDLVVPSTPKTIVRGYIAADTPPVAHVKPGQTVKIDTVSHGGLTDDPVVFFGAAGIPANQVLKDVIDIARLSKAKNLSGHVLTGPLYIDGAARGDMLEVRILKIDIRVPYGVNTASATGVAQGMPGLPANKVIKFDLARNMALFGKDIELPLAPFMGVMAVAPSPELGHVSSRPPGPFGGNMDFKRLTAGATLYLPVFADGALFVTGDSHAAMGDGEVDGTSIEASMAPTLQFYVHKGAGKSMVFPRAEDARNYYTMGMDTDLNIAMRNAVKETLAFLENRGLTAAEAYALASVGIDFGIAEVVDQNLVVFGRIPKTLFKDNPPYWAAP